LPGTTAKTVGQYKVTVARRLIQNATRAVGIDPHVKCITQDIHTMTARARAELRRCHVILAVTDNQYSRVAALQLALDSGSAYLQAGSLISSDADGALEHLAIEVTGAEVNRYCPICTGRLDSGKAAVEARRYFGDDVRTHAEMAGYLPDEPAPAVMSLNSIAAGALTLEIQRRVAGLSPRDLLQVDCLTGKMTSVFNIDRSLHGTCAVCGRGESTDSSGTAPGSHSKIADSADSTFTRTGSLAKRDINQSPQGRESSPWPLI
jgi:hypothetical protein